MNTRATETPRYVLDASVAGKWHLTEEHHTARALEARTDFVEDRTQIIAPDLLYHEVTGALLKATRNPERGIRISRETARREVTAFFLWGIHFVPAQSLAPLAFDLADRFRCSYYDAVYLALAEETGAPFLYADNKLRNALGNRFPLALWIEDYQPAR